MAEFKRQKTASLSTQPVMVQLEKRLLWHPRRENRFVVGEHSQIVLYEWASEYPEITHVTSQHDLHSMKASCTLYTIIRGWSVELGIFNSIASQLLMLPLVLCLVSRSCF
jgi:hypothetical protein